jgi:hypothetical protein
MRKLLPVILALLGLGGGVGAGLALRPAPQEIVEIAPCGETPAAEAGTPGGDHGEADGRGGSEADPEAEDGQSTSEFVKLNNQFIVPVVDERQVSALVILSMSLEVAPGGSENVYRVEPKLRDQFLRVLFDHANSGGFDGNFTATGNMEILRNALIEVARKQLGAAVKDVLIENIVRQDA